MNTADQLAAMRDWLKNRLPLTDAEQRVHDQALNVPDWMQVREDIRRTGEDY